MPISTRQFVSSTVALIVLCLVSLCAIVGSTIWLSARSQSLSQAVLKARDVQALVVDLRAALQTAESSQRGFLYTGNEIYLAPYDEARQRASAASASLPGELGEYPDLLSAVARLVQVTSEKISEMDRTIALKQSRQEAEALSLVRSNRGKQQMDEINLFVSGIIFATKDRLSELVNEQTENAIWLRLVSLVNGGAMLLLVSGAVYMVSKYTRQLKFAQRELSRSNDGLERRVIERTAELAVATQDMREARDRAEMLLAEVNHRVSNSLMLVNSLISLQSRSINSEVAKQALEETKARVQAIAMVHKRLYDSSDVHEVALDEYLVGLLDQFKATAASSNAISLTYAFEPVKLKTDASINLGVIVSEWVMNAFKYAYPDHIGEIRVVLTQRGDGFGVLRVEDDGIGRHENSPVMGTGLGTRIVTAMATSMGATIEYVARSPGTSANLSFPTRAAS